MGPAFSANLQRAAEALEQLGPGAWSAERILECLKGVAEAYGLKLGDAMQPVRVALTGSTVSEPVNELPRRGGPPAPPSPAGEVARRSARGDPGPRRHDSPGRPRAGPGRARGLRGTCADAPLPGPRPTRWPRTPGFPLHPCRATRPGPQPSVRRALHVGDINLGTATLPDGVPPDSGRGLLDAARPALTGDLVVGNFEGVLGDSGTSYKCERMGAAAVRPRHADRHRTGTRGHRPTVRPAVLRLPHADRCWPRAWWTRASRT